MSTIYGAHPTIAHHMCYLRKRTGAFSNSRRVYPHGVPAVDPRGQDRPRRPAGPGCIRRRPRDRGRRPARSYGDENGRHPGGGAGRPSRGLAGRRPYQTVLIGRRMAGIDGDTSGRRIEEGARLKETPSIMLTSSGRSAATRGDQGKSYFLPISQSWSAGINRGIAR